MKRRVKTQTARVEHQRRRRDARGRQGWNASRRANAEKRVDVRRWRAARAPTRGRARRRVKHGAVEARSPVGESTGEVRWKGRQRKAGTGLRVRPMVWARRVRDHGKTRALGAKWVPTYREVDRRTGTRLLVKEPRSGEVYVPAGRKRSVRGVEG